MAVRWSIYLAIILGVGFAITHHRRRGVDERALRLPADHIPEGIEVEKATFGGGCYWCTEAVFRELNGVHSVVSGFSGGEGEPQYLDVASGLTEHTEVAQIVFDPKVISYAELLEVFFSTHDPTTLNRQGNDVGRHYRSVIFYHNDEQREAAEHYKSKLDESDAFSDPIVTAIEPYRNFYAADESHQEYYARNSTQAYCQVIIRPKLDKLREVFAEKLKQAR